MGEVIVIERQTLADLAIQITGDVERMFELAELNDLSVSDWLEPGTIIKTPASVNENDIKNYYQSKNLYPASGWTTAEQQAAEELSGIDYWIVEEDFEVQ